MTKEREADRRLSELQIKALDESVARQTGQITALQERLDEAKQQVQDIAVKAIEGASGARALAHLNQIAMEQAKNVSRSRCSLSILVRAELASLGYAGSVSPTILRVKGFRFYFFSREERRAHVHVQHADGEAKFWIDPNVELVANFSLKPKQIVEAQKLIEEYLNEIRSAWAKHFPGGSH